MLRISVLVCTVRSLLVLLFAPVSTLFPILPESEIEASEQAASIDHNDYSCNGHIWSRE